MYFLIFEFMFVLNPSHQKLVQLPHVCACVSCGKKKYYYISTHAVLMHLFWQ